LAPLAHIGHGPAGLAYNPGTGLPPPFDRHFFLCDFPGHVLMWTNIPDGASFKIGPVKNFFGDLGPTDVAFHPDGGVLVSDWFKTFDKTDKGRLYRIHDPATDTSEAVRETKRLLVEGMAKRSTKELVALLAHTDMRVRTEAQFALARAENFSLLSRTAFDKSRRPARLQAIAALGQIVQTNARSELIRELESLLPLLNDDDAEVRAQAARLMGTGRLLAAQAPLDGLFKDPSTRVRLHALLAYRDLFTGFHAGGHRHRLDFLDSLKARANRLFGSNLKVGGPSLRWPTATLAEILSQSPPLEPYVQYAAVMLLTEIAKVAGPGFAPNMTTYLTNTSPAVRLSLLLAYRRTGDTAVSSFLSDSDPQLVLEAARAINDVPIEAAFPQLAALLPSTPSAIRNPESETTVFTLRRALNANFRVGRATNAHVLAAFAALPDAPEALRIEALELLGDWPDPPARDHIMGLYRPLPSREGKPAADALRRVLASLLHDAPKDVRLSALRAARALGVKETDFFALATDVHQSVEVRVEALKALAAQKDSRLTEALELARNDRSETLRIEAGRLKGGSGDAVEQWAALLERGTMAERQGVLALVAAARPADSDTPLRARLDTLMAKPLQALLDGELPKELQLDVIEAAQALRSWTLAGKIAQFESGLSKDDALAAFRPSLYGGNAENGRKLFVENQQIACFRCHKINGEGGEVGPELTGLGAKKGREYILESILYPNKQIAADYENLMVTLKNGTIYAGQVKQATDKELLLNSPEDGLVKVATTDIQERQRGLSAMPEELVTYLSKRELRDLVEFLATLK
jgi:quinoprotein glucose dehydrogenase